MSTTWIVTTDRHGNRAYCLPTGQVVCKDGTGATPVSVYYAGFVDWSYAGRQAGTGMTDTVREAKAWAEHDAIPAFTEAPAEAPAAPVVVVRKGTKRTLITVNGEEVAYVANSIADAVEAVVRAGL